MRKIIALLFPCLLFFIQPIINKSHVNKNDELVIFPDNKVIDCIPYDDRADKSGMSSCSLVTKTGNATVFSYTLRKHPNTEKNNYAGLSIELACDSTHIDTSKFVDISQYDSLLIDIGTVKAYRFKIHLKSWIDSASMCGDYRTFFYEEHELPFSQDTGSFSYSIPLKSFHVSEITAANIDYYNSVNKNGKQLPKDLQANHKRLISIGVQTGTTEGKRPEGESQGSEDDNHPKGITKESADTSYQPSDVFSITKIAFTKSKIDSPFQVFFSDIFCAVFSCALYLLIIIFVFIRLGWLNWNFGKPPHQVPSIVASHSEISDDIKAAMEIFDENPNINIIDVLKKFGPVEKNAPGLFTRKFIRQVGVTPSDYKSLAMAIIILKGDIHTDIKLLHTRVNEALNQRDKLSDYEALDYIFHKVKKKTLSEYVNGIMDI